MRKPYERVAQLALVLLGIGSVLAILVVDSSAAPGCSAHDSNTRFSVQHSSVAPRIQKITDDVLAGGMQTSQSVKGLIVVQRISTGELVAVASQEGPNNGKCFYGQAEAFRAWEPGSVMKPLITAAALDEGKLTLEDSFYNVGRLRIGDDEIVNAVNIPKGYYTYKDMVEKSINLGAVAALQRLSDEDKIDTQSRNTWYDYLTNIYGLGRPTGAYDHEQPGYIPAPNNRQSTNTRYAYTSFGIGLTVTPVQLTSAYAALVNNGIYNTPTLQQADTANSSTAKVSRISPGVSEAIRSVLVSTAKSSNSAALREGYVIGGKSGTGPSADDTGTYQFYRSVGTYIGFVGKSDPEYIVLIKLDEPKTADTFASGTAAKIWASYVGKLIDAGQVQ